MSQLVEHLAELTGFRDRDVLDVTLAGAFKELLRPESVAIYRVVGEGERLHWLTRARLGSEDAVATADPAWVDMDTLPLLKDHPARCEALRGQAVSTREGEAQVSVFPLETDREVVGVLELVTEGPLHDDAQRMVGSILRIYRNFQGLLDYSERDTLTGLLNRKTFDESFLKISSTIAAPGSAPDARRASGAGSRYWLGMIDIDHFKSVNDTFGHLIGDEVLLLLSRLMRSSFRFHDRLYRFGGEEFVVMMRCDSELDARRAFERLRLNTAAYVFPQVGTITVSIGFSELKSGDSPSAAIERADKAVYWVKTHGRDQVQSHAELVARGELSESEKIGDVELF
jgi:diguanylate cyclase (GGDEF)-like protein